MPRLGKNGFLASYGYVTREYRRASTKLDVQVGSNLVIFTSDERYLLITEKEMRGKDDCPLIHLLPLPLSMWFGHCTHSY